MNTSLGTVEVSKLRETISGLERKMREAADALRFAEAASLRDELTRFQRIALAVMG